MNTSTIHTGFLSNLFLMALATMFVFAACSENPAEPLGDEISKNENLSQEIRLNQNNPQVVEVVSRHEGDEYIFELSNDVIPSGWTTFRLINESNSTHFAYIAGVPQGAIDGAVEDEAELLDYWIQHVTNPFQFFMDTLIPDKELNFDNLPTKYADSFFPYWFEEALPNGGPGFVGGWRSTETTVYLKEGEYIVECYVKNADGDFHSYLNMIELLTVTGEESGAVEPAYTSEVTVSSNGIEFDRHISAGEHTFKVTFEDQIVYDHLLGHDVHLIRMDKGTSVAEVGKWMNWMDPDGLVSSSSVSLGPATFLGGVQTMTAGSHGYFHVELEPGQYAWVSEIPDPHSNQMLEVFNVPKGEAIGRGHTGRR